MPPKLKLFGQKQVFLPNFTVALVRTPHLPANMAQFVVPLNINKLDLRDYLFHCYGVEVYKIRSFVQQMPIKLAKHMENTKVARYYRPRSIKKMTVELVKPFVYPPEPEDLSPWDNDLFKALEKQRDSDREHLGNEGWKKANSPVISKVRQLAESKLVKNQGPEMKMVEVEKELDVAMRQGEGNA